DIHTRFCFCHPTRPKPVNQNASTIVLVGWFVNPFELQIHSCPGLLLRKISFQPGFVNSASSKAYRQPECLADTFTPALIQCRKSRYDREAVREEVPAACSHPLISWSYNTSPRHFGKFNPVYRRFNQLCADITKRFNFDL